LRLIYLALLFVALPRFLPIVFLVHFAHHHAGVGRVLGAVLVTIVGVSGVIGRLIAAPAAARWTGIRVYQVCFAITAVSFLWWLGGSSYWSLAVFAVLFGAGYGGFIALSPGLVTDFVGPAVLGWVLGLLYTANGIGALVGLPLAGEIIDVGGYPAVLILAFVLSLAAFAATLKLPKPAREARLSTVTTN
jgi:MFS family permease